MLLLLEKKNILALGFLPLPERIRQFTIGFIVTTTLCVLVQYLESYLKSSIWVLNEYISGEIIFNALFWDIKSVLTEELFFRGALLYIFIQKIGAGKSILISAIAFGVYHWFSFGVIGNIVATIFEFIGTGWAMLGHGFSAKLNP